MRPQYPTPAPPKVKLHWNGSGEARFDSIGAACFSTPCEGAATAQIAMVERKRRNESRPGLAYAGRFCATLALAICLAGCEERSQQLEERVTQLQKELNRTQDELRSTKKALDATNEELTRLKAASTNASTAQPVTPNNPSAPASVASGCPRLIPLCSPRSFYVESDIQSTQMRRESLLRRRPPPAIQLSAPFKGVLDQGECVAYLLLARRLLATGVFAPGHGALDERGPAPAQRLLCPACSNRLRTARPGARTAPL